MVLFKKKLPRALWQWRKNHMPTPEQCKAAYQREFTMHEQGKCKRKYPAFDDWYAPLNADYRWRVDKVLIAEYGQ